jgi:hypothetical protein
MKIKGQITFLRQPQHMNHSSHSAARCVQNAVNKALGLGWLLGILATACLSSIASACLVVPLTPNTPASATEMNAQMSNLLDYVADLEARAASAATQVAQINSDLAALADRQSALKTEIDTNEGRLSALDYSPLTAEVLIGKEYCMNAFGRLSMRNPDGTYAVINMNSSDVFLKFVSDSEALYYINEHLEQEYAMGYSDTDQKLFFVATTDLPGLDNPIQTVVTTTYSIGEKHMVSFPEAGFAARFTADGDFFNSVNSVDPVSEENGGTIAEGSQSIGFVCNLGDDNPF